jgi:hypothetical protein
MRTPTDRRHCQPRRDVARRKRSRCHVRNQRFDTCQPPERTLATPDYAERLAEHIDQAHCRKHAPGRTPPAAQKKRAHEHDLDAGQPG